MSRLSELLYGKYSNGYGPEDPNWVQFIKDHRQNILSECAILKPTSIELSKYKYRPEQYFVDNLGGELSAAWIFEYINDFRDQSMFNESVSLIRYVQMSTIKKLKASYEQSAK